MGDLLLDRYLTGHVDRISPEAPVPVVRLDREELKLVLSRALEVKALVRENRGS